MTHMSHQELRKQIKEQLEQKQWRGANSLLAELWRMQPTAATAGFVVSSCEVLKRHLAFTPCRLAILRSFTLEPVLPILRAAAFVSGIELNVHLGEFNSYAQEMLNPSSVLYRFAPDVAMLAVRTCDIAPDLASDENRQAVQRVLANFRSWIHAFRKNSQASLLVHTLEAPIVPDRGIFDAQSEFGQAEAVRQINTGLRAIAAENTGVFLVDYDALVARYGRVRWHDERKWLTVRMPIAADCHIHLVEEWMRFLHPLTGRISKALVTDLDNTLWGGVLGEDGSEGIQVGLEYPGAAYRALQQAMLDLYRRGIVLAISSKNNKADAVRVLEEHEGMLLRPAHIAAMRINWDDKAQSLREIAQELNIGLESLAFLDDSPVERARIRQELPEVTVIELPSDPLGYANALRSCAVFERLTLSREDRERNVYYIQQRQRQELEQSVTSVEDFYRSLKQEAEIAPARPETVARIAQLTRKTNQFNLTTRRYTDQQIAELAATAGWNIYSVQVKDRFGDNGIVGVVITRLQGEVCEIDTFLLSCRVIGRTVETAIFAWLAQESRSRGANILQGWFVPTSKNAPAREFYRAHDCKLVASEDGRTLWALDLRESEIKCPEWIRLTFRKEYALSEYAAS